MQWLLVLNLTRPEMLTAGPTEQEMDSVRRHFAYWQNLTEAGQALVVGRTQTSTPDTMGLAVFKAESEQEATQIADQDPAVIDSVFKARVYPYFVALLGDPEGFRPNPSE
jgi:uncharacterized protein YciI